MENKKELEESRNMWKIIAIFSIILLFVSVGLLVINRFSKEVFNEKGVKFYEIANYTYEWSEQYVDEDGYVRLNTTRSSYIDKGMEIEPSCECFEELCPLGSHWQDGSKICYNQHKPMGIVDGIGCRIYVCDKFMVGVD